MRRLTKEDKKRIKNLNNKGLSLRQIQKETNIPLSTLQYNLNKDKNRKRIKEINLPSHDFLKGEILGAFAGDGSFYYDKSGRSSRYSIRFYFSYYEEEYRDYIYHLLKDMNLNVNIYTTKYKGNISCFEIRTFSIKFLNFIKENLYFGDNKTDSICLLKNINNYSEDFLYGFARGLMDTDGFVETYNISCGVISKNLIKNLEKIFLKINIRPNITIRIREGRKNLYLLRIPRKYLEVYYTNIGFSNPNKSRKLINIIKKSGAARI